MYCTYMYMYIHMHVHVYIHCVHVYVHVRVRGGGRGEFGLVAFPAFVIHVLHMTLQKYVHDIVYTLYIYMYVYKQCICTCTVHVCTVCTVCVLCCRSYWVTWNSPLSALPNSFCDSTRTCSSSAMQRRRRQPEEH